MGAPWLDELPLELLLLILVLLLRRELQELLRRELAGGLRRGGRTTASRRRKTRPRPDLPRRRRLPSDQQLRPRVGRVFRVRVQRPPLPRQPGGRIRENLQRLLVDRAVVVERFRDVGLGLLEPLPALAFKRGDLLLCVRHLLTLLLAQGPVALIRQRFRFLAADPDLTSPVVARGRLAAGFVLFQPRFLLGGLPHEPLHTPLERGFLFQQRLVLRHQLLDGLSACALSRRATSRRLARLRHFSHDVLLLLARLDIPVASGGRLHTTEAKQKDPYRRARYG